MANYIVNIVIMDGLKRITIAAMKAAETENEVDYVFSTFGYTSVAEKAWLLEQAMGGQWFDLPKDDEARLQMLKAAFLKGQWRYADKLSQLKNIAKDL